MSSKLPKLKLPVPIKTTQNPITSLMKPPVRSKTVATINLRQNKTADPDDAERSIAKKLNNVLARPESKLTNLRRNKKAEPDNVGKPIVKRLNNASLKTESKPKASSTVNGAVPKGARPKLAKWDFRGRLAYAEDDLASSKDTLRNLSTRNVQLASELSELSERGKISEERAEKAEALYNNLAKERDALLSAKAEAEKSTLEIKQTVSNMKAILEKTENDLKECNDNYENYESNLAAKCSTVKQLESVCIEHKQALTDVQGVNSELRSVMNKITKKREELLQQIETLRANN